MEVGSETKLAVSETEVVVSVVVFENEVAVNAGMELGMEASVAVFENEVALNAEMELVMEAFVKRTEKDEMF